MSAIGPFEQLVTHAGRVYVQQRLSGAVTDDARRLVEAMCMARGGIPPRYRPQFDHFVGEMQDALFQPSEPERAASLSFALGEFSEWLLDLVSQRSSGQQL